MKFFIDCIPPKGTHQSALRILKNKSGKQFVGKMSSSEGKKIQEMLIALLMPHKPTAPLTGPLQAQIAYAYPWRKSEPKKNRATGWKWKDTKPDADNLPKTLKDCMTRLGFWEDDAQVTQFLFEKAWADKPGIRVKIVRLDPTQPPKWYNGKNLMT